MRSPQYWLARLDEHDNPTLIDGSHDSEEGVNRFYPCKPDIFAATYEQV